MKIPGIKVIKHFFTNVSSIVYLLLLLAFFSSTANSAIKEIISFDYKNMLQIVLETDEPAKFRAFPLKDSNKVIVDINTYRLKTFENNLNFYNRGVQRVRVGTRKENDTRVVVDLFANYYWKVYSRKKYDSFQIVIEVYDRDIEKNLVKTKKVINKKPLELTSLEKSPEVKVKKEDKTSKNISHEPKNEVTRSKKPDEIAKKDKKEKNKKEEVRKDIIVLIDPGHGGRDPGALGKKSKEKDLVLKIGKKLKKEIDKYDGMKAILTRETDKYISLRGRLKLARKHKADVFVSIHADAFIQSNVRGSSVYILSNRGASSEAARWLAKSENASDLKYGVKIGDYDKDVGKVLMEIQQDVTIENSYEMGKNVLSELKKIGKVHKKTVERAGFAVLKSPDIPSILVETAFISNPYEEKRLGSSSYQNKLAKHIAKGIKKYYDNNLPQYLLIVEP